MSNLTFRVPASLVPASLVAQQNTTLPQQPRPQPPQFPSYVRAHDLSQPSRLQSSSRPPPQQAQQSLPGVSSRLIALKPQPLPPFAKRLEWQEHLRMQEKAKEQAKEQAKELAKALAAIEAAREAAATYSRELAEAAAHLKKDADDAEEDANLAANNQDETNQGDELAAELLFFNMIEEFASIDEMHKKVVQEKIVVPIVVPQNLESSSQSPQKQQKQQSEAVGVDDKNDNTEDAEMKKVCCGRKVKKSEIYDDGLVWCYKCRVWIEDDDLVSNCICEHHCEPPRYRDQDDEDDDESVIDPTDDEEAFCWLECISCNRKSHDVCYRAYYDASTDGPFVCRACTPTKREAKAVAMIRNKEYADWRSGRSGCGGGGRSSGGRSELRSLDDQEQQDQAKQSSFSAPRSTPRSALKRKQYPTTTTPAVAGASATAAGVLAPRKKRVRFLFDLTIED